MCLMRSTITNLCPKLINFDALDFSECHSEEVTSFFFFWHSVYTVLSIFRNLIFLILFETTGRSKETKTTGWTRAFTCKQNLPYSIVIISTCVSVEWYERFLGLSIIRKIQSFNIITISEFGISQWAKNHGICQRSLGVNTELTKTFPG